MKRRALLLTTFLAGLPALAHADTFFDLHIPASACRPILGDLDSVKLSDGAWVFESGESGPVTLFCPLHLSAPDDLAYSNAIARMRLWYKDADAALSSSHITATLKRRKYDASVDSTIGSTIHSNNNNWSGFTIYDTYLNHTANFTDYSYHVEVTMYRFNSNFASPVFVGLDFEPPPTL